MWNSFIDLQNELAGKFTFFCDSPKIDHREDLGHYNYYWKSNYLDMGHISVVDKREEKGIWMMHVNAYSKSEYPMPIYGFDVVCSEKKVTGCFHDLSPTGYNDMPVREDFRETKKRNLPEWAWEIFSREMVAAGNVSDFNEIAELVDIGANNLMHWFDVLLHQEPIVPSVAYMHARSKYCQNQLLNPHSFAVMLKLGFPEDYLRDFKTSKQFPY
jgi:hypothetical protein